ncbi:MAG: radical SAM family heme chaperone HemW [Fervidobacterium sp.]|nr:radical SAM family heme chaperone HemW [Fervidobacterium sp.]
MAKQNGKGIGVYVHIPFCKKRCIYCDFTSYVENNFDEYTDYMLKEIEMYSEYLSAGIDTIYIGGGTPSIFPEKDIKKILEKLTSYGGVFDEITIEVNPESFTKELAQFYKWIGINRLSMGLQSSDDLVLKRSGRLYDFETFIRKYDIARRFFENINVDFIVGLPGESWRTIQNNVQFVNDFLPDHVSVYMLEVHNENGNGFLKKPDEQTYQRYDEFLKALKNIGYERYEISNFSLGGKYCKHNIKYWNNDDYIGLGIASGGHLGFLRYNNYEKFSDYFISILEGKFPRSYESLNTPEREALETLFMNLRTKWGTNVDLIRNKTGVDVSTVLQQLKQRFDFFDGLRLSDKGMDFSNLFFVTLINIWEEYFG